METYRRICIEDFTLEAKNGDRLELKRGTEYLTSSIEPNQTVTVFTTFWVPVPVRIFAADGVIQFT